MIIPHGIHARGFDDVTCYQFCGCGNNGTYYKYEYRLFNSQEFEYPEYDEESDSVYGKPGAEEESSVDESPAVLYKTAPDGFIYPAEEAVGKEELHVVPE